MSKYIRGIALIEMIAVIVVLGLSIPILLTMWADVTWRSIRPEAISQGAFLAEELMEEIKSKKFDEFDQKPPSGWSNPLGPESGETRATYDDVDDFDGFNESPTPGFPGYSRSVIVTYVDPDNYDLNTPRPDSENDLNYKRVAVTVTRNDGLIPDIELITIITTLEFL